MERNLLVRGFYAFLATVVAFSVVLSFGGVGQAQAATSADPWLRTGGAALRDEFDTIMAHGGAQPVTDATVGASSTGAASVVLGGAGIGLSIGTSGLRLYSKVTTGEWGTYTDGLACGGGTAGKILAGVGQAFKFMSFGLGGYTCATAPNKLDSDKLATVDLSNSAIDKDPVPYVATGFTIGHLHYRGICPAVGTPSESTYCFDITSSTALGDEVRYGSNDSIDKPLSYLATMADGSQQLFAWLTTLDGLKATSEKTPFAPVPSRNRDIVSMARCKDITSTLNITKPECHVGQSVSVPSTPPSTLKRDTSCRVTAGDGTHFDVAGDSYTDADGLPLDSGRWGCNKAWQQTISAGKTPTRVTATSTFPGATGDPQVLLNQPVTKTAQETVTKSPECMAADSNSSGCVQRLYKRIDGKLRSCADADVWEQCSDWSEESQTNPDEYVCKLGSGVVPLTQCAMYEPTFKYPRLDAQLHYKTDVDSDTAIDTDGVMAGQPDGKNCWAQMISWNPVDWVLTPIKCAAIWAFVPTDTNSWQRVGTAWDSTAPAVVVRTLSGGIEMPEAGNGCSGPPLDLKSVSGGYLSYVGYPLSACDEPMKTMAQRFKLIAQVLLMASTLWMVIRNITAMFNVPPPPAAIQPALF